VTSSLRRRLIALDRALLKQFGPQGWWPTSPRLGAKPRYRPGLEGRRVIDREAWEIVVGAILTQNTAWQNVELALANLSAARRSSIDAILEPGSWLEEAVRPSGYFRQKADRLRRTARAIIDAGGLGALRREPTPHLRERLLSWHGVGPETADSILCYAFARPVFVVDAYTTRLFEKEGLPAKSYAQIQDFVHDAMEPSAARYGDLHARIVKYSTESRRTLR
jgi:endonuclease III related protein